MDKRTKLLTLACWWGIGSIFSKIEKDKIIKQAKEYAKQIKKPILNLGCGPFDLGGENVVNVDVTHQNIPNFLLMDANKTPYPFPDKYFSSVVCNQLIEHLERPYDAIKEMHRCADKVFINYPDIWTAGALATPTHKWLVMKDENAPYGLKFIKWSPFYFWLPFGMF